MLRLVGRDERPPVCRWESAAAAAYRAWLARFGSGTVGHDPTNQPKGAVVSDEAERTEKVEEHRESDRTSVTEVPVPAPGTGEGDDGGGEDGGGDVKSQAQRHVDGVYLTV